MRQVQNCMFSNKVNIMWSFTADEKPKDEITNPVLVIDDLDYATMLVFHRGRGHRLFWLQWLCCFLLQLLLSNKSKLKKNTKSQTVFDCVSWLTFWKSQVYIICQLSSNRKICQEYKNHTIVPDFWWGHFLRIRIKQKRPGSLLYENCNIALSIL